MKKYCVYVHTNKINNKKYVGQTCQEPEKRWKNGNGYRKNTYFGKAIKKYGWENFEHEIIASNLTKDEADNFETILIKKLETKNPDKGYNLTNGGDGMVEFRHTEESKKKMSQSHKGKYTGENNPFFGRHHSKEAKQKNGEAHRKENLSNETLRKMSEAKKGKKRSQEAIEKGAKSHQKSIICLETGIIYSSIKKASEETNINSGHISDVCKGNRKTAGGYHWQYYIA